MDANDLATFRNARRNRRSAWSPKSAVYPVYQRQAHVSRKATIR
jgi:hypothetical protein